MNDNASGAGGRLPPGLFDVPSDAAFRRVERIASGSVAASLAMVERQFGDDQLAAARAGYMMLGMIIRAAVQSMWILSGGDTALTMQGVRELLPLIESEVPELRKHLGDEMDSARSPNGANDA